VAEPDEVTDNQFPPEVVEALAVKLVVPVLLESATVWLDTGPARPEVKAREAGVATRLEAAATVKVTGIFTAEPVAGVSVIVAD
jgi:hypothetical protein